MLFAAVGTAVLAMFAAASVTLTLETQKSQILVGEPVKLVSTWSSQSQQHVTLDAAWLWIDDGMGYQRHQESSIGVENGISVGLISPDQPLKLTHLIAVSGQLAPSGTRDFRLAWPRPGTYRVKLQYRDVESNAVVLSVSAPQGSNAELLAQQLQPRPEFLTEWATLEDVDIAALGTILDRYRGSPYLYRPQLLYWKRKIKEATWAFGATGGPSRGESALVADVGRVLADIETTDWRGSAFDEDRLLLMAETRKAWGGGQAAVATYREIVEKYPDSPVGSYARDMLVLSGDRTPPVLAVAASPGSLWPPNHKLTPIAVNVQVSEDHDSSPAVKLVSITCDDACDPALDIVGATYGTDDRQFDLRSERKGTSTAGRTYTITYSAEDAGGNKTTATTTVTVPHDQGN
jgi:hypothetical protein